MVGLDSSKKINAAIVSTVSANTWAGSEEYWYQTAMSLLKENHSVFASVYQFDSLPSQHRNFINAGGMLYTRKKYRWVKPYLYFRKIFPGYNNLFNKSIDVIIFSLGAWSDCILFADLKMQLQKHSKVKLITLCLYNSDHSFLDKTTRELIAYFTERASVNFFVSEHNFKSLERQVAFPVKNPVVVPAPTSYGTEKKFDLPLKDESSCIKMASVARFDVSAKGQDVLLEALSSELWKHRDWKLILYGLGHDKDYITDLIKFYKLQDKVFFGGYVSDTREIWKENQILIMPSRSEGQSLAFLEALMCGRICVVTDVGGFAEVIEDGVSGYLAEAPTAKYISRALDRMYSNRTSWQNISKNAIVAASELLSENPVTIMIKYIKGIINE